MPDRTNNNSETPSTLPRPELNPLLNPLLAENMGRWANVYYTSPPEKRQEAVLELLHELERENSHSEPRPEPTAEENSHAHALNAWPSTQNHPNSCPQCGHENSADQKFCGMCGVPLLESASTEPMRESAIPEFRIPDLRGPESRSPEFQSAEVRNTEFRNDDPREAPPLRNWNLQPDPAPVSAEEASGEPPQRYEEFPRDRSHEDRPHEDRSHEYERPLAFLQQQPEEPTSYRRYIGAALAVVIFALGYVAWRNTQHTSTALLAPQAPPASTEQPVESTPAKPAPSPTNSDANHSTEASAPNTTQKPPQPRTESTPARPNQAALVAKDESGKALQLPVSAGGSQELAVAEGYLNGTNGRPHDSAAAAQWLWKAVEKRNTTATMLLSDLYLKGNGVPKNCDQAHVLLDAAASRGVREAAERLRNLKAYGCE